MRSVNHTPAAAGMDLAIRPSSSGSFRDVRAHRVTEDGRPAGLAHRTRSPPSRASARDRGGNLDRGPRGGAAEAVRRAATSVPVRRGAVALVSERSQRGVDRVLHRPRTHVAGLVPGEGGRGGSRGRGGGEHDAGPQPAALADRRHRRRRARRRGARDGAPRARSAPAAAIGTNMSETASATTGMHGVRELAAVTVDAYNAELRDREGFVGDRASSRAFRAILEEWREMLRRRGDDPLGEKSTDDLSKKKLDRLLIQGEPEAAGLVQGAIEEFAVELAKVTARFLELDGWRETERIVVGGGLRASRVGELAIGRASVILKAAGHDVELRPIHHDPDEAGLLGAVHLAPPWMLSGHDAILAVDVGGSNIRAGIVELKGKNGAEVDFSRSIVLESELWAYGDEETKLTRDDALNRIGKMLQHLARRAAKQDLVLAPFVGVGCPGIIAGDGSIERGGQNLPGNWETSRFNLPAELRERVPTIDGQDTTVAMHNDAVVQGLSDLPFVQDVEQWAVLTIGTGLGNAAFTNRKRRR